MLRLDPCLPAGVVWFAPALPAGSPALTLANLRLGSGAVSLKVSDGGARLHGLAADIRLIPGPMPRCGLPREVHAAPPTG
jgi:hypothetical protein